MDLALFLSVTTIGIGVVLILVGAYWVMRDREE